MSSILLGLNKKGAVMKRGFALLLLAGVTACETPTTPRYAVSADNVAAIRRLNANGVLVGDISEPQNDAIACRMAGNLRVQDNLTHAQYIRKALQDELTMAGAAAEGAPRITLSGQLQTINAG